MNYAIYNPATGEILRSVDCPLEAASIQVRPGEAILEGEVVWGQQYVLDGMLTDYTPEQAATKAARPSYAGEWNNTTFSWSDPRDLSQIKTYCWNMLKRTRDQKLQAPLLTDYGVFDADTRSQKNITDAVQLLQVLEAQQPNQTIEFTLSDNTVVTLTTQQMTNVGLALGQRTQQIYNISRQLRTQLDLAQTAQEVEAITWPT